VKYLVIVAIFFSITGIKIGPAQDAGIFIDDRDGNVYEWVRIGNQTWMAVNLAYLPRMNHVSDSQFEGKCFYVYNYNIKNSYKARQSVNYKKYGVLYNWVAALDCCPKGWHLPSDQEWIELEKHLGMDPAESKCREWRSSGSVGYKLKSTSGWETGNGTNESGFNALPGGCRGYGGFESLGHCAYFWTASPAGGDNGWRRGLCGDDNGSACEEDRRYFGFSVRCLKD
jgi:uncharacterized protein (TIGR02145 family)